jgi:hypothetical protein
MALNIKNPEVHAVAAELARLRKVSVTQAVLDAVRHELTREKDQRTRGRLGDQLIEIGKRCAAHLGGQGSSADHATLLYDGQGLPR